VARDAAVRVSLGTLGAAESLALLTGIVGDRRMAAEPEAAAALGGICAGLPLALRIAGATLAEQPDRPVADYVAALRAGDRVAALAVAGDEQTALTTTFDLSYQRLDPAARQLFRLLSLVPGVDVTVGAAAALCAASPEQARRSLLALAGTHLCDETTPGRYGLHDLLRDYAASKAHAEDSAAQQAAATDRLFSWYLHTADAAGRIVAPRTVRLPLPPRHAEVAETAFEGRPEALAWLDAERPNLIAAIRQAAARGPKPMAWLLPDALDGYLGQQEHTVDRFTAAQHSVAAATEADDAPARAAAHIILGRAHHAVGEDAAARTEYLSALRGAEQLSWPQAKATALVGLGAIAGSGGPVQAAVDYFSEALAIRRAAGTRTGQADLLANIGRACVDLAELDRAKDCCEQALAMYQEEGSPRESHGWYCLGCARHALGDLPGAEDCFARARDLDRQLGTPSNEARELAALAMVALDRGRSAEAHGLADLAVGMARDLGDPEVECIALVSRAETSLRGQRYQAAAEDYRDALRLTGTHGIRLWQSPALVGLGFTVLAQGDAGSAAPLAEQALSMSKQVGHRLIEAPALRALSESQVMGGQPGEAMRSAREALAVSRDTGQRLEQMRALMALSRLSHRAGRLEEAARDWQVATALAAELGVPEPAGPAP
jgi:tetratricopeptide (TPR) repeat protein